MGDALLYAISREDAETSRKFIEKIEADGEGPVEFRLLSDPDSTTIDRYALRDPVYAGTDNYGLPRPSVFVLDREGTIRWSRIENDYTQRPETSEIQAALDAVK